ncbi:MAG: hypothetical protein CBE00_10725 [Planctomycetaceae bacterium TMED240]|nr:hypothetical protein [Rhodopirellula sp.]OUX05386.1 MAG: hypothetical protein CBE00_10725 [Planctomycetaceae bacterium TMED240]
MAGRTPNLFCKLLRKYPVIPHNAQVFGAAGKSLCGSITGIVVGKGATMGSVCGAGAFTVQLLFSGVPLDFV